MKRSVAVLGAVALVALVGCSDSPTRPDGGPSQALIELIVQTADAAPVAGAAASFALYLGEACDGERVAEVDLVTDATGIALTLLEAPPGIAGRVTCLSIGLLPPAGSDLQQTQVEMPNLLLHHRDYVPSPPKVRIGVTMES